MLERHDYDVNDKAHAVTGRGVLWAAALGEVGVHALLSYHCCGPAFDTIPRRTDKNICRFFGAPPAGAFLITGESALLLP